MIPKHKPIVVVILDGWGETQETQGNAIAQATLPITQKLDRYYPKSLLQASGISVGLPWGESGNSEVGHQAIGTGQIIYQNLPRITLAIEDSSFFQNPVLMQSFQSVKAKGTRLHLMGLLSDGAVHSHIDHLFALLECAKEQGVSDICIHAITDGRDTPPKSAEKYVTQLQTKLTSLGVGVIATLAGRYYTMDRNNTWDRIKKGYDAMIKGVGIQETDPIAALQHQYAKEVTDEFLEPVVLVDASGAPVGSIQKDDVVLFFNYREDRARQITKAMAVADFHEFDISDRPPFTFVTMIEYEEGLPVQVAFPPQKITTSLGKILSENGKKQLRIAETEKYAHVTYFFNGGVEKPYPGEDHVLIPSKSVPTYDQLPRMSAQELTDRLLEEIARDTYDFILVNYANPDMVGHTGNLKAGIEAVEFVDACLGKLIPAVLSRDGCLLITADHGNVEEMVNLKTGEKDTEHSCNPVPCWFVTPTNHRAAPLDELPAIGTNGMLCDIAATVLELFELGKDPAMECDSLLYLFQQQ